MKVYVDRFEGKFVVLIRIGERGGYDVPKEKLGFEVHEGDVLEAEFSEKGELLSAVYLADETAARREKYASMMARLRKRK